MLREYIGNDMDAQWNEVRSPGGDVEVRFKYLLRDGDHGPEAARSTRSHTFPDPPLLLSS